MLSMGFIFIIILFLTSIIIISRYVLSDENALQKHVVTTRNLLDDIEKVEKQVNIQEDINIQENIDYLNDYETINFKNKVSEYSYLNIGGNNSIISFKLNKKIYKIDNVLYIKYINPQEIEEGDIIAFNLEDKGIIIDSSDDMISVFNIKTQDVQTVSYGNILGKIIYDESKRETQNVNNITKIDTFIIS